MELKPCRKCGSNSAVLEHNDDGTWKVFCWWNYSCGCTTKNFDTEQDAIESWNRRIGEGGEGVNREILFRGKRIDHGEWIEGYYLGAAFEYAYIAVKKWETANWAVHPVDPATTGQYTGLTDKNGKRIWENINTGECET